MGFVLNSETDIPLLALNDVHEMYINHTTLRIITYATLQIIPLFVCLDRGGVGG